MLKYNKYRFIKKLVLIFFILILSGCSEHKVDTFKEWCELISGENLKAKYAPFWATKLSLSIDEDRIRKDFAFFLNSAFLKKVKYQTPKMAWRKDKELHLVNLSVILKVKPESMIKKWKQGIELSQENKHTNTTDICLYETVSRLFESLHIHTRKVDKMGKVLQDNVTIIPISPSRQ